jgi:mono/diheme cytochrome c family protein
MSQKPIGGRLFFALSAFAVILLTCSVTRPAGAQARQLPEGAGKVTTQRICGGCHAPEIVIGKHLSKEGWEQLVGSMVEKGATGTDDEFNQIIDYLAANFPDKK